MVSRQVCISCKYITSIFFIYNLANFSAFFVSFLTRGDALNNLVVRVPSTDMSYLVISVLLQRETGGNLAALLDSLSKLIRERMKLLGTIKVLSAEGKLSAQILTVLPFVLALAIHLAVCATLAQAK
ncbi:MAG TPA: type II secretion system F family protein [Methylotenera sp.]|nr:type II secretion system F family protein [Methylotenera sp.]HQS43290.1 type II secretion system F family protein [Methylotenera sp.]